MPPSKCIRRAYNFEVFMETGLTFHPAMYPVTRSNTQLGISL